MALYNNPYQYSFGVPGQMNQFQQQPVQMPAQPVQQPQQNNNGILWSKELGVGKEVLSYRYRAGWTPEECLFGKESAGKQMET